MKNSNKQLERFERLAKTNLSMTSVFGLPSSLKSFPSVSIFRFLRIPDITCLCFA